MTGGASPARVAAAAVAAAGLTWGVLRSETRLPEPVRERLARRNHAGATVTLLEGPATILGSLAGVSLLSRTTVDLLVVALPGVIGVLDDLIGDTTTKGLRGHLRALRRGQATTGSAKVAVIGATAVLAAGQLYPEALDARGRAQAPRGRLEAPRPRRGPAALRGVAQRGVDTALIAGSANLVNLLDLRPGRALKVVLAASGLLLVVTRAAPSTGVAAVALGAGTGALADDLAGRSMLGDGGANLLGGLVGVAAARSLRPRARLVLAGGVVALTVLSERVSFSKVIDRTPWLRAVDAWGRPSGPPRHGPPRHGSVA